MGPSLRNFVLRSCSASKSVTYHINILIYSFIFKNSAYKNITRRCTQIAPFPPFIIDFFIYILLRIIHYVMSWLRDKGFFI